MANIKISELAESNVLVGDEVLPIVQGGITKKVSVTQIVDKVDAYTKSEVDSLIPTIPEFKTINGESILGSGDLVISGGGAVDLSDYYKKTETYSKVEVDGIIDNIPTTDLSNYYDKTETYSKAEVENLISDIPPTDLSGYYNKTETYNKTEVDSLIPDISTKQDNLVSGTNIKTINGQSVLGNGNIFITAESASPLLQPIITSPANGTVDFNGSITSTYSTSESYAGVQDWVKWEVSTDENFTTLIDSYEGSSNLTSWSLNIGLDLTTVYVRTKQGSDNHLSAWSDTISFTTPDIYIENPTLTVAGAPSSIGDKPVLTTSAFSVVNGTDTHISTDWIIEQSGTVI